MNLLIATVNTDPSVDFHVSQVEIHMLMELFPWWRIGSDTISKRVERASFEFNQQEVPKFGGCSNAEFLKIIYWMYQQNIFSKADWSIVSSRTNVT